MYHEKRYLQFNDLVFDGYDMISNYDESTAFKAESIAYSHANGSYFPFKSGAMLTEEKSVTLTLSLHTRKIPCDDREFYVRFAEQELSRPGRLWAIKNNEIIWAYAYVKNMHQIVSRNHNRVEYDIEFGLPEGVWHKADKQKTFVLPYSVCTFMECKGFKKYEPCESAIDNGDCCEVCEASRLRELEEERCFCCCVDEITADMALCFHRDELGALYGCETPFQFVYDCAHAEKFNKEKYFGHKLCVKDICDSNIIAGRFYSNTDLETNGVTIVIDGSMHNPSIEINGNTNVIEGDYEGALVIKPNGDVFYRTNDYCEGTLLDPSVWIVPSGNNYGWKVKPLMNSIIVNLNRCCNGRTCVYVYDDSITL